MAGFLQLQDVARWCLDGIGVMKKAATRVRCRNEARCESDKCVEDDGSGKTNPAELPPAADGAAAGEASRATASPAIVPAAAY